MTVYSRILVPLEHSPYDAAILAHVRPLAKLCGASILLIHVADGFAARHFKDLDLRESEEMQKDRAYLDRLCGELAAHNLRVSTELAMGDPATELIRVARARRADLIAMSTHGHRGLNDLLRGTTVNRVRHEVRIPVLLLRAR